MKQSKSQKKVTKVMKEWKSGTLHSGKGGPVVKSRKQAVAIALSEAKRKKK
jgi:ribosomal protein L21E